MEEQHADMHLKHIAGKPWEFLAVFLTVFFLISVFLFIIDFVPEPIVAEERGSNVAGAFSAVENYPPETPRRVVVKKVGIDTVIGNPESTDIPVLDNALLSGAVRYPESGLLGETATVYLFAHQSGLPVVKNPAFKAFNGVQNLEAGDEVTVYSDTAAYTYRVSSVELVDAAAALIPLDTGARKLALSTCNSFGKNTERFVVTADFVSRTAIN